MGFLNCKTASRTPVCLVRPVSELPCSPGVFQGSPPLPGLSRADLHHHLKTLHTHPCSSSFPSTGIFPHRFLGICFSLEDSDSELVPGSMRRAGEEKQGRKKESQQSMLAWLPPSAMEARPCSEPFEKLCAAPLRYMSPRGQEDRSHYSHLLPPRREGHPRGIHCLAVRTSR